MTKADYKSDLLADLTDSNYAAAYLSAALADSPDAFLVALRDVAEAQKGVGRIAQAAEVNRENLYRMLSPNGNPRLDTLKAVLEAMGFQMSIDAGVAGARARRLGRSRKAVRRKGRGRGVVALRRVSR